VSKKDGTPRGRGRRKKSIKSNKISIVPCALCPSACHFPSSANYRNKVADSANKNDKNRYYIAKNQNRVSRYANKTAKN